MCTYFPSEADFNKKYLIDIRKAVKAVRSFFANKAYPPLIQKISYHVVVI